VHTVLGILALLTIMFGALYLRSRKNLIALTRHAAGLETELKSYRSKPITREFRMLKYDVLWFPVLTIDPKNSSHILNTKVGLPYCQKCILPLKAGVDEQWICMACGFKCAGTVVDIMITDGIAKIAETYYGESRSRLKSANS